MGKLEFTHDFASRLEAYYNVESPDAAPDWSMAFTLQFLFPK
ncbi:MAG: hypothetical protein WBN43_03105 [Thiogranum sp.]